MSQDQYLKLLADVLEERLRMRAPRIPGNQQDVAIRDTLRGLSDSWGVVQGGSTAREYGLASLLQSGLAETRFCYRVRMRGCEEVLNVTIVALGWGPDVDVEDLVWDSLPKHWTDAGGNPSSEVYFEGGGVLTEARLTICGLNARHDIEGGGELATVALNWAANKLHLPEWRVEKVEVQTLAANGGQQAATEPAGHGDQLQPSDAEVQGDTTPHKASLNARMIDVLTRKPECRGWSVKQWRQELKCSAGGIAKTPAWKGLMKARLQLPGDHSPTKHRRRKQRPKE